MIYFLNCMAPASILLYLVWSQRRAATKPFASVALAVPFAKKNSHFPN